MSQIAALLADLSARTGHTDEALARVVGVRQSTFTRWRNGTVGVGQRHAARIAHAAGVDAGEVAAMIAAQPAPAPIATGDDSIGELLTRWEAGEEAAPSVLAPRFGVSLSIYLRWRKGLTIPAATSLATIAEVVGVPLEQVVMAAYRSELARRR